MKMINRSIWIIITLAFPFLGFAQVNPLDNLMNKYSSEEGCYFLNLKTNMFNPASDSGTIGTQRVIDLKMLSVDQAKHPAFSVSVIYNEFMSYIDKGAYKGLIEIKKKGENVEFLIKKEGEQINGFIVAVKEANELTLISASGNFNMKDLMKLSQFEKCKGLQILGQLCEE